MERVVQESVHSLYGVGATAARERAEENAKERLAAELSTGFDAVPCPNCGWYHSRMVSAARNKKCQPLVKTWAGCVCLGGTAIVIAAAKFLGARSRDQVPEEFDQVITIVLAGCGSILLVYAAVFFAAYKWRFRRLDLNRDPLAQRLAFAQKKGAVIITPPPGAPNWTSGGTKEKPESDDPFATG